VFVLPQVVRNRALSTLMFGHFSNDLFAGVLPILFPAFKDEFHVSNAQLGFVTLAYAGMASLCQPLFGHLADRRDRRWYVPVALLWSGIFVSLYGFAGRFNLLIAVAALAGLGSGAFHPLGATNAAKVVSERTKNTALSLYTVAGTIGWAIGPLIAVALLAIFGLKGTGVFFAWGVIAASLLYWQLASVQLARKSIPTSPAAATSTVTANYSVLVRVVLVVMLRSWVFLSLIQYVPTWFNELGYSKAFYGALTTMMILGGAVGTLIGGSLADRIGGRVILIGSLSLSVPALMLFAGFPGYISLLTGALFGLLSDSSLSVTLVAAQRLWPGRTGIASGMILGLGFVTGGIGVPVSGRLADSIGFQQAFMVISLLGIVAALVATTIPRRALDYQEAAVSHVQVSDRKPSTEMAT
jgi:FSR family fosmidomycin resistance protein-like MFS transporter